MAAASLLHARLSVVSSRGASLGAKAQSPSSAPAATERQAERVRPALHWTGRAATARANSEHSLIHALWLRWFSSLLPSSMPVGHSLLDDLEEAEPEDGHELLAHTAASVAASAASTSSALLALQSNDAASVSALPAHTPLAKYLQRLNGEEESPEITTREPEEKEEAEEEEADSNEQEREQNSSTDAAPAHHLSASAVRPSIGTLSASLLLLLELVGPGLARAFAPTHTLADRSKLWCIDACVQAQAVASAAQARQSRGLQARQSSGRARSTLQQQQQQIASQLAQIRQIYVVSIVLALLQVLLFASQLLLLFSRQLGLTLLLPLMLGSSSLDEAALQSQLPPPPPTASIQAQAFIYLVLCIGASWNAITAYVSDTCT